MADFLFDGPNRIITEPAGTGDTQFDVGRDLYSAWKRWIKTGEGAKYLKAFEVEGGTPIGATGLFTGSTIILINGWKIRAASHDHQLFLDGNLFSDDGITSVLTPGFSTSINITASVAAQGISSGSGLSNDESTKLAELHQLAGLDPTNLVSLPPESGGSISSGNNIDILVSGDCETGHTLERQ